MSGEEVGPERTSIAVSRGTLEWLASLKVHPNQSYDEVLQNLKTLLRRNGKNHRNGA